MEVKINQDIRKYTESMFFGLSLRQFGFSLAACAAAVVTWFVLRNALNGEVLYWTVMASAVPFAFFGFFTYNGLTAEKFIACLARSHMMKKRILQSSNTNYYYALMFKNRETRRKRGCLKHFRRH